MFTVGTGSTCAHLWLFAAVLGLGWVASAPQYFEAERVTRFRQPSPYQGATSCLVPKQPINGQWKLHRESCDDNQDCDLPQDIMVKNGSKLVYNCDSEYRLAGNPEVSCETRGAWSDTPRCISTSTNIATSEFREIILAEIGNFKTEEEDCVICGNVKRRKIYKLRIQNPRAMTKPPPQTPPKPPPVCESCFVPQQPANGHWKLHRRFCDGNEDCDLPQGTAIKRGRQLVYTCDANFVLRGSPDVYCQRDGQLSDIPTCHAITCEPLNSMSRAATCAQYGDRVRCNATISTYTTAKVTCRQNYGLATDLSTGFEQSVECRPNGRWEPKPIECTSVCGVVNDAQQNERVRNEDPTEAGVFPWHANLWKEINTLLGLRLSVKCSATIIRSNLVVTAAHCVIDEKTKIADHPRRFRVSAGRNVNNDSDGARNSPLHKVKNVYRYCEYAGRVKGYTSDIALVELQDPFVFSSTVLPVCLDTTNVGDQDFQPGATGRINGFGVGTVGNSNSVLHTTDVAYIPNCDCKAPYNPSPGSAVISDDEFCAVYSNETTVCNWNDGGGFVVQKNGLWHLTGVFVMDLSLGFQEAQETCGRNPYSLYTKVFPYMAWIEDVMLKLGQSKSYPLCCFDAGRPLLPPTMTGTPTITSPGTPPFFRIPLYGQTGNTPETTGGRTPGQPEAMPPRELMVPVQPEAMPPRELMVPVQPEAVPLRDPTSRVMPPQTPLNMGDPKPPMIDTISQENQPPPGTSAAITHCSVPSKPANGQLKLNREPCDDTNCDVQAGAQLRPGSQLIYKCNPGFQINGNSDGQAICTDSGLWSATFECAEVRCDSLKSESRVVTCHRLGIAIPCESRALPETVAKISCRSGYVEETSSSRVGQKTVLCSNHGRWEQDPIDCVPLCGVPNIHVGPVIVNGAIANISRFPWHATLYKQSNATNGPMEFQCGATIIQNNLLLTAAHCVMHINVNEIEIPGKYRVATGNIFRDYDYPEHDPRLVQKSRVKNFHRPCDYFGLKGNYASDIALIELETPFNYSDIHSRACMDALANSDEIFSEGTVGEFAGFGRTATDTSSGVLLTANVTYVGSNDCRKSVTNTENRSLVLKDKFCGGTTKGVAVCKGDSGGGLMFNIGGSWRVMGVLSVSLGVNTMTNEFTCDDKSYALYTKVSEHMPWITDVMIHVQNNKTYPACGKD